MAVFIDVIVARRSGKLAAALLVSKTLTTAHFAFYEKAMYPFPVDRSLLLVLDNFVEEHIVLVRRKASWKSESRDAQLPIDWDIGKARCGVYL